MPRTKVKNLGRTAGVRGSYSGNMTPLIRFFATNLLKQSIGMKGKKMGPKLYEHNKPKLKAVKNSKTRNKNKKPRAVKFSTKPKK